MYQVGDHIVYRNIGICTVEAIGKLYNCAKKKRK